METAPRTAPDDTAFFDRHQQIIFPRWEVKLHAMLINFGRQSVKDPSYSWDGMKRGNREFVIWQHTLSGEGELEFEGRIIPQTAGRSMLLVVPEKHVYRFPAGAKDAWSFVYLTLHGAEAVRLAREYRRKAGASPPPEAGSGDGPLAVYNEIVSTFDRGEMTVSRASALAYSFMLELLASAPGGRTGDPLGERIRNYCLEHLDREVGAEEMARHFHYSRSYFCRIFRELTGYGTSAYMRDLRLRLALQLLQTSGLSVKEIAARCGFAGENYFCRVFRKVYGKSPGAFRER